MTIRIHHLGISFRYFEALFLPFLIRSMSHIPPKYKTPYTANDTRITQINPGLAASAMNMIRIAQIKIAIVNIF